MDAFCRKKFLAFGVPRREILSIMTFLNKSGSMRSRMTWNCAHLKCFIRHDFFPGLIIHSKSDYRMEWSSGGRKLLYLPSKIGSPLTEYEWTKEKARQGFLSIFLQLDNLRHCFLLGTRINQRPTYGLTFLDRKTR